MIFRFRSAGPIMARRCGPGGRLIVSSKTRTLQAVRNKSNAGAFYVTTMVLVVSIPVCLGGCGAKGLSAGGPGRGGHPSAMSQPERGGDGQVLRFRADPQRLPVDVVRALEPMHWAKVRLDVTRAGDRAEENAAPSSRPEAAAGPALRVRALALLPDNRKARIDAWSEGPEAAACRVRVGNFGDERLERAFLKVLGKVLAGKPKPQRGGTFELPE